VKMQSFDETAKTRPQKGFDEATTSIPTDLLKAYRETHYRVDATAGTETLSIGQHSPWAAALLASHAAVGAAFLTAWNPYSEGLDPQANTAAQNSLTRAVEALGCNFLSGKGVDPSGEWPGEDSLLVIGITLEQACKLGRQFKQNAFVYVGTNATPELILLR
jgi:hypothetical protein